MKSKQRLTLFLAGALLIMAQFSLLPSFVSAASGSGTFNYQPVEPIPGFELTSDFPTFVTNLYKFGIWAAGISAMIMIMIGGFFYMTAAGNSATAGTGKKIIADAILGLIIVIVAWLILYVINPELVNIQIALVKFSASAVSGGSGGTSGTTPTSCTPSDPSQYTHAEAVQALSACGISVSSSGGCSDCHSSSCTSLDGIPKSAVTNLCNACSGCSCRVTGGTEAGHRSHGAGKSCMDINESSCMAGRIGSPGSYNIRQVCTDAEYRSLSYNCGNYTESNHHFHMCFN